MRVIRISVVVLVLAAVGLAGPKDVQRIRPLRLPEPVALLDGTVIMATNNTWQSKDGDWGNTASWSLGIVPTSGHAARFDATSQVKPTIRISLGSNGPDTLTVTEQFHGGIGGPGNYLSNVAVNTTKIVIRGDGDHYIRPTNDASVVVNMVSGGYVELDGTALPNLHVVSGTVLATENSRFEAGAVVATNKADANLTIQPSDDTTWAGELICYDGFFFNRNKTNTGSRNTIYVDGGTFRQEGIIEGPTLVYSSGGVLEYAPIADPAGNLPGFVINGVLDVRDSLFAIPVSFLILGPESEVLGSALENSQAASLTIDLRQDNP